jgi:DNA-binding response OmpR family regulator
MKRILVVEDEAKLRRVLVDFLQSEGYEVVVATDGEAGLELAYTQKPDVIILDVMLPKMNGFDVCRSLRERGLRTPILMITAKGEETDKVLGLELGADDYLTKPFGLRELNARVRARLRNTAGGTERALDQYSLGTVLIDFKQHCILRDGRPAQLSALEAGLLKYFIEHRGEVVSRNDLLDKVWGYDSFPTTRTIDTHVLNLRKKLEDQPDQPRWLLTVHGVGYKFTG